MKNITHTSWTLVLGLSFALIIVMGATSQAAPITITPITAVDNPPLNDFSGPVHLIDSSGLSGTVGVGDDALKTHDLTSGGVDMWVTVGNTRVDHETVTFGLAANVDLAGTYIWNYNQDGGNTGRGVKTFNIETSTDGGSTFSAVPGPFTLAIAGGAPGEPAQFLPFSALGVNVVRFDILTNQNGSSGNDLVGLSEVRFAVPEPASASVLMFGLASAGMLRRRSRR